MDKVYQIDGFPAVKPNPEQIPAFLKALPSATWIAEPRGEPGKYNKAPRNPASGRKIGASKPELFGTFEQAVTALRTGRYSGLGVLLSGHGVVGIDIDSYKHAFEERPEVSAWVAKAMQACVYCERSPSGKGLRLFMNGKLPGKGRRCGPLEIYDNARFLTVTGNTAKGSGMELIDGQALIDEFLAMLPPEGEQTASALVVADSEAADLAMVEKLSALMAEKHPHLWAGNWHGEEFDGREVHKGYPSQSEADYATCGHILREALREGVKDGALADTVMAVFECSGLYRDQKRQQVETYAIPRLIAEALAKRDAHAQQAEQVTQTETGAELADHEPGDILAGKQFARAMRGKLAHVSVAGKWLRWEGTRWVWCACGEEMQAAKWVAGRILEHAAKLFAADPNKHGKLLNFAKKLQNLARLQAMIELAKSEDGMSIGHMAELDSDPMLLGVRNGVVNLRDGGLLTADPKMLITRQVAAEFHSDAECPSWLAFLSQVFEGDQETIDYLQRALGYTLTGKTGEEKLFICFGHGANGKSVFANVVSTIMADYSQAAPASLLTVRRPDDTGARNDLAMLCGARLVSINETANGDRLDEQVVKQLAGREQISARFLHKEFFQFWPTAKPWLRTNHKPIITGEDDGIWRRLDLIGYRRKFAEHERDPNLEEKLLEERNGILAWMIRGCLEWQRHGLKPSATVRRESATYRKESDLLGEFLDDRTERTTDARIERGEFFAKWRCWCDENGYRAGTQASISRKMTERSYEQVNSNGKRYYAGVAWRSS